MIRTGNKKAIKINKLLNDTSTFLSTIQIAITLSGLLASAFAADTFTDQIVQNISINYLSIGTLKTIILIITTMILSYFSLVFGELIPKKIGLAYPMKVSICMVSTINIISKICYPFIMILSYSTNLFVKLFHIKTPNNEYSEEDIKRTIISAGDEGVIEKFEQELILKVFEFNDTEIIDIMTPVNDVIFININDNIKDIISLIKHSKYTRFPVYENNIDNVIGILNIKDLIIQKDSLVDLKKILRKVYNLSYDNKIDDTFYIMKKEHLGIAVVKKESKTIGIVTMEDIIEEIVGNIYDEYDISNKKTTVREVVNRK